MESKALAEVTIPEHANLQRNVTFSSQRVFLPSTVEEVQRIVQENKHVKAQGSLHCFNTSADTYPGGVFISLKNLRDISIDKENKTVTFGAGIIYGDLIEPLDSAGLALKAVLAYDKINIVGSVLAAAHGSGYHNKIIAAYVTSF